MAGHRAPFHFGGPMGLAGLAMLAGSAGLFLVAGGASLSPAKTTMGAAEEPMTTPSETPTADVVQRPATNNDAESEPVTQPAAVPTGGEATRPAPTEVKQERADSGSIKPASGQGTEVTFIVRIKGSEEADIIARNFKRDPAAARQAYAKLCDRSPALRDFQLVGASYSGDLKLTYQFAANEPASPDAIRSVRETILAVDGVAYADPDRVAHPGKDP